MTAEILIMNKHGVSLAADSAVTISAGPDQKKIYNTSIKLFSLSKHEPVGIMIYGSADLMGMPWEILIKSYRKSLGEKAFSTLKEYQEDFFEYLANNAFKESFYETYVSQRAIDYFVYVLETADKHVDEHIQANGEISTEEIQECHNRAINETFEEVKKIQDGLNIKNADLKDSIARYRPLVVPVVGKNIAGRPIHGHQKAKLIKSCLLYPIIFPGISKSGLVFAGFGEMEQFPSGLAFEISKVLDGKIEFAKTYEQTIDLNNTASIKAFAQTNEVQTFMNGISNQLFSYCHNEMKGIFESQFGKIISDSLVKDLLVSEENADQVAEKLNASGTGIVEKLIEQIQSISRNEFINPVVNAVTFFSPTEMAGMAETLVNLESFRKQVTLNSETVGGPIDVCVITKGDGYIWIKRKHYFDPSLNSQFFFNYNYSPNKEDKDEN